MSRGSSLSYLTTEIQSASETWIFLFLNFKTWKMHEEKFHDTEYAQSFYSTARYCNLLAITKVTHVNAHSYLSGCWTETRHCSEDLLAVALVTHVNAHSYLTGYWTQSVTVQMQSWVSASNGNLHSCQQGNLLALLPGVCWVQLRSDLSITVRRTYCWNNYWLH